MPDPKTHVLETELEELIVLHKKWEGRDFMLAHIFVWLAIIASLFSALFATQTITLYKLPAALIGLVPTAMIVVDKTVKFSARSAWHARYRASLNGLSRKLRDEASPVIPVAQALTALEGEMAKMFPSLGFELLAQKTPHTSPQISAKEYM